MNTASLATVSRPPRIDPASVPRVSLAEKRSAFHLVMATNDLDERRSLVGRISTEFPDAAIHPMLARGCKNFMENAIGDQRILVLLVLEKAGLASILSDIRGTKIPQRVDHIYHDLERNPVDAAVQNLLQGSELKDRVDSFPRKAGLPEAFMRWLHAATHSVR